MSSNKRIKIAHECRGKINLLMISKFGKKGDETDMENQGVSPPPILFTESTNDANFEEKLMSEDDVLQKELCEWVEKFGVPNTQTNELLRILRRKHKFLPKDARALRCKPMDNMDGGEIINNDIQALRRDMKKMEQEIMEFKAGVMNVMQRILEDVTSIREELVHKKTVKAIDSTNFPFACIEDFEKFEREVQESEEKYAELVSFFMQNQSSTPEKFIKASWRSVLMDDVAQEMCWKGTGQKQAVKLLTITTALREANSKKFPGLEVNFEKPCVLFFQQAKNRLNKKKIYKEKDVKTNSSSKLKHK